jgi:hypothetical protein
MKTNKIALLLLVVLCITTLTSCAPNGYESDKSGFFSGIWHGIIIVFSLVGKLFGRDIGIYAEHNTGFTYWLGFIIGIGAFGGGSNSARR